MFHIVYIQLLNVLKFKVVIIEEVEKSGQSNNRRNSYPQLDCLFVLGCNALVKLAATCDLQKSNKFL